MTPMAWYPITSGKPRKFLISAANVSVFTGGEVTLNEVWKGLTSFLVNIILNRGANLV